MSACEYIFRFNMNTSTTTEVDGVTTVRMGTELHERIVRCRDCKYMSRDMHPLYYCYRPEHEFAVSPNGYCKWGERKADA